jgi:cytidylate kinase
VPRVVAVDGPAGAGKSSASQQLATRLGYRYLDTGSMYRMVGVLAAESGIALDDDPALVRLIEGIEFAPGPGGEGVLASGRDLSVAIRRAHAGELASRVSTRPAVRARLVAWQRRFGAGGDVVMEGRDIGTVVFPDAPVKFYLTATAAARAARRAAELRARGEPVEEAVLAAEIAARDQRDLARAAAPLRPAPDAVVLDTTQLPLAAVIDEMERVARPRLAAAAP